MLVGLSYARCANNITVDIITTSTFYLPRIAVPQHEDGLSVKGPPLCRLLTSNPQKYTTRKLSLGCLLPFPLIDHNAPRIDLLLLCRLQPGHGGTDAGSLPKLVISLREASAEVLIENPTNSPPTMAVKHFDNHTQDDSRCQRSQVHAVLVKAFTRFQFIGTKTAGYNKTPEMSEMQIPSRQISAMLCRPSPLSSPPSSATNQPHLDTDHAELLPFITQRLVPERQAARADALLERVVQPQPVMSIAAAY